MIQHKAIPKEEVEICWFPALYQFVALAATILKSFCYVLVFV